MMHELRKDPILGRWVAVLDSSKAPDAYSIESVTAGEENCILCPGRERETPQEIAAIRESGKWLVRDIPSFMPVFQIEGDLGRKGMGMYDKMNGIGANEIVIESPQHNVTSEDMGPEQMLRVIRIHRERVSDLEKDPRMRHILVLKNSGRTAGAKYSHPYSEIIATPVIPKKVKEELDNAKLYFALKERCIFCDIMREETRLGDRVICETRDFICFSPYAPTFPFEFWIMPKRHCCAYGEISTGEMEDLSLMLTSVLKKLRKALRNPPYNYFIHTAPNRIPRRNHWHTLGEDFHWHIEIVPRLFTEGGFELGSGFYMLTTSPEDAAKYLREA